MSKFLTPPFSYRGLVAGDIVSVNNFRYVLLYKGMFSLYSIDNECILTIGQSTLWMLDKMVLESHSYDSGKLNLYKTSISCDPDLPQADSIVKELSVNVSKKGETPQYIDLVYSMRSGYLYIDHYPCMSLEKYKYLDREIKNKLPNYICTFNSSDALTYARECDIDVVSTIDMIEPKQIV